MFGGVPGSLVGEWIVDVFLRSTHGPARSPHPVPARPGQLARGAAASATSCAPRPSAGSCWSSPRWSRWCGRTRRGRDAYRALSDLRVGPAALHLDLTLAQWAADGLLAIFFFVAGLELKREFVAGDLRDPRRAALPVAAAVGGMAVPALIYVADQRRGRRRRAGRLGDPDRHRHRVRARRARGDQHAPARRPCARSCSPSPWSTTCSRSRSSPSSTPSSLAGAAARARAGPAGAVRGAGAAAGAVVVAAAAAGGRRPGCWSTSPGVHATVAGVLLGFTVPVDPPLRRGPGPGWPSTSSTGSGRCRPAVAVPGLRLLRRRA